MNEQESIERSSIACPHCGKRWSRVIDSRVPSKGEAINRRRVCQICGRRFSTKETVVERPVDVRQREEWMRAAIVETE